MAWRNKGTPTTRLRFLKQKSQLKEDKLTQQSKLKSIFMENQIIRSQLMPILQSSWYRRSHKWSDQVVIILAATRLGNFHTVPRILIEDNKWRRSHLQSKSMRFLWLLLSINLGTRRTKWEGRLCRASWIKPAGNLFRSLRICMIGFWMKRRTKLEGATQARYPWVASIARRRQRRSLVNLLGFSHRMFQVWNQWNHTSHSTAAVAAQFQGMREVRAQPENQEISSTTRNQFSISTSPTTHLW